MVAPMASHRPRSNALPVFVIGFLAGMTALRVADAVSSGSWNREGRLLLRVRDMVSDSFVDPLEPDQITDRALKGLVQSLDDYSNFYTGAEIDRLDRETTGLYRGIGVLFRRPPSEGQILFALADSPAHRAGLLPGDRFVRVAGHEVLDLEPGELQDLLRDPDGEQVDVEVETLDGELRSVALTPEPVVDPSVRHGGIVDPEAGIAYVAISSFSQKTPREFFAETDYLESQGMRSLVLDMRGNPGGVLDSAIELANAFIPDGVLLTTRSRDETQVYEAQPDKARLQDLPLVVLVDGDSASASEVFVGAVQDYRVGAVVGEPTYGKGVVQSLTRFGENRAILKMTSSRYYTPSGRRIDRGSEGVGGIAPDVLVEVPAAERDEVRLYLNGYSAPHDSRERLEEWELSLGESLVTPRPSDSALQAALNLLRDRPLREAADAVGIDPDGPGHESG